MSWTSKFRPILCHFITFPSSLFCLRFHLIFWVVHPFILPHPMILGFTLILITLWYLLTHLTVFPRNPLHIRFHMKPSLHSHTQYRCLCPTTPCPKLVWHFQSPKPSWTSQVYHLHLTTKSCCLKRWAEHFQQRVCHRTSTAYHREFVLVTIRPVWSLLLPRICGTRNKCSFRAVE